MTVEQRLQELGLTLPAPPPPAAHYKRSVRAGDLVFLSGQLPWVDGEMRYTGHVGAELSDEEGYQAARVCALNALAQIRHELGSFDALETIVRVDGHVSSAPGWHGHPHVLDGASDLFHEVLGERAGHARIALGHNELPLNAAVELVLIVACARGAGGRSDPAR